MIPAFCNVHDSLFSGPIIAHGREFASFFCEFSGWQTFKEMEVKGYLQKQASAEDGRVTYLTITDAGRALSARYNTKYFRALVPYLDAISDQDADTMIRTIETFYQVMCERRGHLDD